MVDFVQKMYVFETDSFDFGIPSRIQQVADPLKSLSPLHSTLR